MFVAVEKNNSSMNYVGYSLGDFKARWIFRIETASNFHYRSPPIIYIISLRSFFYTKTGYLFSAHILFLFNYSDK